MAYGGILGKSTTTWTNSQIMSTATAGLYGLGANAVPDDVLEAAKTLIDNAQNTADGAPKIVTGSYVGTGQNTNSISFELSPKIVFIRGYNIDEPTNIASIANMFYGYYIVSSGNLNRTGYAYIETYSENDGMITLGYPLSITDTYFAMNETGLQYNYYAIL